jgi:hypothetical protein
MIADLLGHSRIGITMDLYSHIPPAMRRDTADAMDQDPREPVNLRWPFAFRAS